MLVQTLVYPPSEELLARVDRWVVEHVLPGVGTRGSRGRPAREVIGPHLEKLAHRAGERCSRRRPGRSARGREDQPEPEGTRSTQFAASVDRLPASLLRLPAGSRRPSAGSAPTRGARHGRRVLRRGAATLVADRDRPDGVGSARSAARGDQARARPGHPGHRDPGQLVVVGLRAVEPGHPGAARPDDEQPQGRPGAAQRQHRAGQLAVPQHRQEDVRRDEPAARRRVRIRSGRPEPLPERSERSDGQEQIEQ